MKRLWNASHGLFFLSEAAVRAFWGRARSARYDRSHPFGRSVFGDSLLAVITGGENESSGGGGGSGGAYL